MGALLYAVYVSEKSSDLLLFVVHWANVLLKIGYSHQPCYAQPTQARLIRILCYIAQPFTFITFCSCFLLLQSVLPANFVANVLYLQIVENDLSGVSLAWSDCARQGWRDFLYIVKKLISFYCD